ncbi:2-oxoglutarate carboxylase large subunit [Maioricimonas rarisocia]|uniref:2-oxoglutarate carboxylase large subunit n=2 Tax=Maioricimonas rarisocia TaxID=2528026 RepID=A0A517Z3Q7_9PLAN|nr:2-oxoglutarate carboxylase large subunit [Maioricimonas rarisocia]
MCTAFRDGFQSVYGARVFTKDFLPALEAARDAGIDYFEAGGGARYQSLYFYCNEDAFDMMDQFRVTAGPDANLQTLARGINVVGLESQSSDVIDMHAKLFRKHGITTIRNFDALNDVNNLIHSGQCIVNHGLKHQVCVTLMALPPGCTGAHDPDFYEQTLRGILDADIPFDSVCFKDASGTAYPATVYETIRRAREILGPDAFIHYHTHETAGISVACNRAALDAGASAIDLSLAPVSGGTCQPDLIVMWHALRGTDYELDVDIDKVREAEEIFKECMADYFLPPEAIAVEPLIPWSPMPGGALTANTQMLRDNGIMDKYPELIRAMREVVEKGGFGTSVTPVSQFYIQQAFNNVMFGPWEKIAEPYGRMVLGYFGKTPVPPDPDVVALASKQLRLQPTTTPPLELNDADPDKGLEAARRRLQKENLEESDENLFIVATCGEKGIRFLKGHGEIGVRKIDRAESEPPPEETPAEEAPVAYAVRVNGRSFQLQIEGNRVAVNGKSYEVDLQPAEAGEMPAAAPGAAPARPPMPAPAAMAAATEVHAQMPGRVLKIHVRPGDPVTDGQPILILEAMKMEVPVNAPTDGTIATVDVAVGDQVANSQLLATIG